MLQLFNVEHKSINSITKIICTLINISILSRTFRIPYSNFEKKLYSNIIFHLIIIFSMVYQEFKNINYCILIMLFWYCIKNIN